MPRRPRPQKVWTAEAVPAQFAVLLDNFKRIEAVQDVATTATNATLAAKINEMLTAIREITQGRRG